MREITIMEQDKGKVGLIVEGGGLRAIFSAGVLDYFISKSLTFPYVIGVSAGALYSASYVSGQYQRSLDIQMKYHADPRYMGLKHLVQTGNYINAQFTFYDMAKKLVPYDFNAFRALTNEFEIGAFNCSTGATDFFSSGQIDSIDELIGKLIASSNLPFISKPFMIDGTPYLDGGLVDPIPITRAIDKGCDRLVILLSQHESYKKEAIKFDRLCKLACFRYPSLYRALMARHDAYNDSLAQIAEWEKEGRVFVIRPEVPATLSRLEKDKDKVAQWYQSGFNVGQKQYKALQQWLDS